jgi:oligopeptide/dipeptide ABC transporter ATP-binding protein
VNDYPHEFSGGMRQRVMIAMAIGCGPKLLIADEPTTALDVTTQGQIINLLRKCQEDLGMAILMISHDLNVIAQIADRVAVIYAGNIVEIATVTDLFERPQHPYTQALIEAIPVVGFTGKRLPTIEGTPPRLRENYEGCSFYPRCAFRIGKCANESPVLRELFPRQLTSCFVNTGHS